MKKFVMGLLFFMITSGLFSGKIAEAKTNFDGTDVGISFTVSDLAEPEQPLLIPEEPFPSIPNPKPIGRLPSTGGLITSLILTLIGFSLLIIFIGVFSLRNIILGKI
ncbi:hypothetical protein UAW_01803 [Enterococcus haemoperoxidus ATCC BAA-382]|uniref:LPXTG-domain-containing protein cell wall anchor domain n=1 Tax=Enterococcus haemoperoxidus ATCC BAA-382 TaxID=1158608 RepID=R2QN43_9ENTE|nr:hypothetical protein [Enterococcus haemoperoxidus]EOH96638.1 hypothetical protein UAW_01803 [Enterococcus haemoperoxidus ATCC BAA-382]EOT60134.1 hypothetical protein I583_02769 [Enterococcus haemoperoxidus ATCC BAA-382]OJG51467.1 hypothetical protein RV06_GL001608 [Enterococcus haemoperoxidus]